MFFDSWDSIARMAAFGSAAYVCAVVMLRISGSRTLSKMNAFGNHHCLWLDAVGHSR